MEAFAACTSIKTVLSCQTDSHTPPPAFLGKKTTGVCDIASPWGACFANAPKPSVCCRSLRASGRSCALLCSVGLSAVQPTSLERLQVVCMLSILPLAFFLGSQSQFGRLNPANPRDYYLLARKALRALRENDLKVSVSCLPVLPAAAGALQSSLRFDNAHPRSPARTSDVGLLSCCGCPLKRASHAAVLCCVASWRQELFTKCSRT